GFSRTLTVREHDVLPQSARRSLRIPNVFLCVLAVRGESPCRGKSGSGAVFCTLKNIGKRLPTPFSALAATDCWQPDATFTTGCLGLGTGGLIPNPQSLSHVIDF